MVDVVRKLETFRSFEADEAVEMRTEQTDHVERVVALLQWVMGSADEVGVEGGFACVGVLDLVSVGSANSRR